MLPFLTQKMLSDSVEDKNSSTLGKSLKKERKNVKTILFFCAFLKFIATNLQLVISLQKKCKYYSRKNRHFHGADYRPFHKTLPRTSAFVNWISVRFYD